MIRLRHGICRHALRKRRLDITCLSVKPSMELMSQIIDCGGSKKRGRGPTQCSRVVPSLSELAQWKCVCPARACDDPVLRVQERLQAQRGRQSVPAIRMLATIACVARLTTPGLPGVQAFPPPDDLLGRAFCEIVHCELGLR